jgi:bacillolysin
MKTKLLFCCVVALIGVPLIIFGQKLFINQTRGLKGQAEFTNFKENNVLYNKNNFRQLFKDLLVVENEDIFVNIGEDTDAMGSVHVKYQQYYQENPNIPPIKVEHGIYKLHIQGSAIHAANGNFIKIKRNTLVKKLDDKQAFNFAINFIGAKSYKWLLPEEEAFLKAETGNPKATYMPKAELTIIDDPNTDVSDPILTYKFDIYAQQPLSRNYVYVSAATGKIVWNDPILKHANILGNAMTKYRSARNITTDSYNKTFRLREVGSRNIHTLNMRRSTNYNYATDFTDKDNKWIEHDNIAADNAALDAHWGAEMVLDYWKTKHGRNSFDNKGAFVKNYVHYGVNYENAYWDGLRMTYGDGGSRFKPLTSLDICAHEIGHAICQYTANLTYVGESGALNEGLSDIWAATVENSVAPSKNIWLIGENIDKARPAIRSMMNPNAEWQPDTYGGAFWKNPDCGTPSEYNDYCGVHSNSGVFNFWFYLLATGGSGTNDIGSNYLVQGITIDKAAKIAYRAETVYMTSTTNFAGARAATIQAAKDLYGVAAIEVGATTNAWFAVGVGANHKATIAKRSEADDTRAMSIKLYPNPVVNELQIDIKEAISDELTLQIYNVDGKLVQQNTISALHTSVDVADLSDGIYVVQIRGSNYYKTHKLSKVSY